MTILNKAKYISDAQVAAGQLVSAIINRSNIATSVSALYATIDNKDAKPLDKGVAIAQVVSALLEAIPVTDSFKKYIGATSGIGGALGVANDILKLTDEYVDENNGGTLGPNNIASLISNATGLIAGWMSKVPPVALPKFLVQVALEGISQVARVMSIYLPDAETAYANAIADAEADMAELQELREQLDIERAQMLDDFVVTAESIQNDYYDRYLTRISDEAEVLGVTSEDLAVLASDYYVSVGLLENYPLAQSSIVTEATLFLTEYEQYIDSLQIVNSNQEFKIEIEKYIGYVDENIPGSIEIDFVDLIGQYYIAVQGYVEQELLDQFDQDIEDITTEVFDDASAFIKSELALVEESDGSKYSESLNNDLANKKQEQQQEAQEAADNKTDNSELKDKLNDERDSYQREAEEIAQDTTGLVSQHVKETLEESANSKIEEFINELLDQVDAEAAEEHGEVECPLSHQKVDAWERDLRKMLNQALDAETVEAISDAWV